MQIKSLILENFRGYEQRTEIEFENITALIGKNDAGKSTILEALDIFFNEGSGVVKPEATDSNVQSGINEFKIGVVFSNIPEKVTIDTSVETNLEDEYLLNENGDLELIKTFISGKMKTVEIRCKYPIEDQVPCLHSLKITDLKKMVKEQGLDVEDNRKASLLRKKIFEHNKPFELEEKFINIKEDGAKQIWDTIQKFIPSFSLFQSDRKNEDKDSEVQDPMKAAIKEILSDESISKVLEEVFQKVKSATTEVANLTIEKLSEMNPDIAKELKPDFQKPAWDKVFSCGLDSDLNIPLNKRGSGVRRLVLLNFFRAKVEKDRNNKKNTNVIYAFEEPETALHPNQQKMLINSFINLSNNDNTQVIFTTHSPEIAKLVDIESLRLIEKSSIGSKILSPSKDILNKIVDTLGILPTIEIENVAKVKVALCVEGKNDIDFLKSINNSIPELKNIVDLESDEVIILPLGGSTLKFWVNNSYLSKLNLSQVHIYDSDKGSVSPHKYKKYIDELSKKQNCRAFETIHREMENYITLDVLKTVDGFSKDDIVIECWESFDVPEAVAKCTHSKSESDKSWEELSEDKRKQKLSRAKVKINSQLAKDVTKDILIKNSMYDEIKIWFESIRHFVKDL